MFLLDIPCSMVLKLHSARAYLEGLLQQIAELFQHFGFSKSGEGVNIFHSEQVLR